jgi:hypothetical protein
MRGPDSEGKMSPAGPSIHIFISISRPFHHPDPLNSRCFVTGKRKNDPDRSRVDSTSTTFISYSYITMMRECTYLFIVLNYLMTAATV